MAADFISCSIQGCNSRADRRGWCNAHYLRWYKYGDPLARFAASKGEPQKYFDEVVLTHASDDCLIWPHAKDRHGYGRMKSSGRMESVHRMACQIVNGPNPAGKPHAAHTCGNGHLGCCNPRHTRWASVSENQMDRVAHGTSNRGAQQGRAVLTDDDVHRIRSLIPEKTQREIAAMFGVNQSTISSIHRGKLWSWLTHRRTPG